MNLPIRFKEAFKTVLATAVASGTALAIDSEKPIWAGFAAA